MAAVYLAPSPRSCATFATIAKQYLQRKTDAMKSTRSLGYLVSRFVAELSSDLGCLMVLSKLFRLIRNPHDI